MRVFESADQLQQFAAGVAVLLQPPCCVGLSGPIGAGKTTFVQGLLRGLGYHGIVKSPTYTLVEHYPFKDFDFYHIDLYRLADSGPFVEHLRELQEDTAIIMIEWPERLGIEIFDFSLSFAYNTDKDARCIAPLAYSQNLPINLQSALNLGLQLD